MEVKTIVKDYSALRQAASEGRKSVTLDGFTQEVKIQSHQLDQDPQTRDELVASYWDGGMSSGQTRLTFHDQSNRLEFSAATPTDWTGANVVESHATIDLTTGTLLKSSGDGPFQVEGERPAPPPPSAPSALDQTRSWEKHILQSYEEARAELGQATVSADGQVVAAQDGTITRKSWDGGMSSPTVTETFHPARLPGGKSCLEYTQDVPAYLGRPGSHETHLTPLSLGKLEVSAPLGERLREKMENSLGGRWEAGVREVSSNTASEPAFVTLANSYSDSRDASNAYVFASKDDEAAAQQSSEKAQSAFQQVIARTPQDAQELFRATLGFAREGLGNPEFPRQVKDLQPTNFHDLGDGIYCFTLSQVIMTPDVQTVLQPGTVFVDTTPGQNGMEVAWAKRA